MTSRERIKTVLEHREPDRVPILDEPWGPTVIRWHREGLPEGVSVEEYFGHDTSVGLGADLSARYPIQILEKTEKYFLTTTPDGGKRKHPWDISSTPEIVDTRVKTKEDWFEFKARLQPDYKRIDWATLYHQHHQGKAEGKFICFNGSVGYERCMTFMNSERLLLLMAEDPETARDMFETVKKGGGYIYHSDHSVSNNVSFQDYQKVMELVKKYGKY